MLFQLINKRYENHSTIITTNKHFGKWHKIFGNVTIANAILYKLLHYSQIINGKSKVSKIDFKENKLLRQ